jgi:sensor histidine kinase YesM
LQKIRFGNGLEIRIEVGEGMLWKKIVPVTLQNLIENAIKHNIIDDENPLRITLFTEHDYLVVQNNLQKKTFVETSNRQGLNNLKMLYGYISERALEIKAEADLFTVKIPLL